MRELPLVNLELLERELDARGLDALVCRSGTNVAYLSGAQFPGTLGRHLDLTESPRPIFVVFPRRGDPQLVLYRMAADVAELTGWADVRVYAEYEQSPVAAAADAVRDLGLDQSRLGLDVGGMGALLYEELVGLLPNAEISDCTEMLESVRAIKTPAEVERLRHACSVMDRAYQNVVPTIEPGETERAVHARLIAELIEQGAQVAHGMLQTSSNPTLYGGESDHKFMLGDHVRTDYVAYVDNYTANLSRVVVVGEPSDKLREEYESFLNIYLRAGDLLRPGLTGGEVFEAIQALFHEVGRPLSLPIAGHGVGIWFHQQPPIIAAKSLHPLEPGMVVAFELASGNLHLQDMYLLAANGSRDWLSDNVDLSEPLRTR